MKASQAIKILKVAPSSWTLKDYNDIFVSFSLEDYVFIKYSNKVVSYKEQVRLINRAQNIDMVWEKEDVIGAQLWSYVISAYITDHIVNA